MFCSRVPATFVLFYSLLSGPCLQAQTSTELDPSPLPSVRDTTIQHNEGVPLVSGQSSALYIQTLQRLYLTQQDDQALLIHINSLLNDLSLSAKQAMNKTTLPPLVRYSLSHDQQGNLVTSRQRRSPETQHSTITTTKIHVYGIDPFVSYRCSETSRSCWLRSPIHGEPWLEISKNEEGAKDLAYAITLLIKHLQKDGQGKAR